MQTLSQRRAKEALKLILDIGNKTKNDQKQRDDFKQLSKSVPTMIFINGIGQAIAFLKAKGEDKHNTIYNVMNSWLVELGLIKKDLLKELNDMDSHQYHTIQREALHFFEWIKRYANAEIFE